MTVDTAQFGAPVKNGSTSIPALAAAAITPSTPTSRTGPALRPADRAPDDRDPDAVDAAPLQALELFGVGVACGSTPQKLAGTAPAVEACRPSSGERQVASRCSTRASSPRGCSPAADTG